MGYSHSDATAESEAQFREVEDAVADAPLVLRVEIGEVALSARAWASLSPGDVIPLGRPLGTPVVLRVAGVEIGRGELVEVEGEVGVRLLETHRNRS